MSSSQLDFFGFGDDAALYALLGNGGADEPLLWAAALPGAALSLPESNDGAFWAASGDAGSPTRGAPATPRAVPLRCLDPTHAPGCARCGATPRFQNQPPIVLWVFVARDV